MVTNHDNVYVKFLATNMLLSVNTRKKFRVIYTGGFLPAPFHWKDTQMTLAYSKAFKAAKKNDQLLDDDIEQLVIQNRPSKESKETRETYLYTNTIHVSQLLNNVYVIGMNKFLEGHLSKWSEYIDNLIKDNNWYEALNVVDDLYHGRLQHFSTVPQIAQAEKRN